METKREFKPSKYLALCCNSVMQSKYSGHFCSCSCGLAYVDETEYYARIGGEYKVIEEPETFGEDKED